MDNKYSEILNLRQELGKGYIRGDEYRFGYLLGGAIRGEFVNWLKNLAIEEYENIEVREFINNALVKLNDVWKINDFDMIIYPELSHNKLMEKMVALLDNFILDKKKTYKYEMLKRQPKEVKFSFNIYYIEHDKMTENEKKCETAKVQEIFKNFSRSEYFSIARSGIPLNKRRYTYNFISYDNDNANKKLQSLNKNNKILIFDDVNTTGSTIREIICNIHDIKEQVFDKWKSPKERNEHVKEIRDSWLQMYFFYFDRKRDKLIK